MHFDYGVLLDFLVAGVCGAVLGLEREIQRKPAGLRTNMLIALGAALFTYSSLTLNQGRGDPARIAAQIVVGVGFLGAGAIIRHGGEGVIGLTSAATVWVVAAIGMLSGAGNHIMAIIGTVLAFVILHILGYIENGLLLHYIDFHLTVDVEDREGVISAVQAAIRRLRISVHQFETHPVPGGGSRIEVEYHTSRRANAKVKERMAAIAGVRQVRGRAL
jgi:putative Mg2+ transporter-C (MgtC) family protein